ncbi:MAG: cation:proton antiporter [Flavipsychrobacter sp.]|nr:cation:proton antiporter [Flavipsychrobacter sp.]
MVHLPGLIIDLGLILGAAAIVTLVFRRLKQPTVLGYILAGLLVGPHFPLFPTITDTKSVEVWAEIGVIFLLFSLGLEFSFKKLMKVGGSASITAIVEVAVMLLLGYITGMALGWNVMDSIFLGGVLSISSTTIIIRAFDELGVKGKKFAGLVFGILVVEDLVAIVLLVLLSTVAVSRQFAGTEMLFSIVKLVFFLVLWFIAGIFFLPSILKKARSFMTDEMLLIASIALCLMMVILATNVGFSPALGAFIMGSILAETTLGGKIEHLTMSVKDLFGAVFFVSVGMLIDPKVLLEYAVPILLITLVTVVGKMLSTTTGALISGQPLKTSVQAGMSLSQIGEFSFIIATLGLTLKVTSAFIYPIAVAVSAITTFTTPYMIKGSGPFYAWLNARLPRRFTDAIDRYSSSAQSIKSTSDWRLVIRSNLVQAVIFTVIIVGIVLLMARFVIPYWGTSYLAEIAGPIVTLIIISPFLWALAIRKVQPEATERLKKNMRYRGALFMLRVFRLGLALFFVGFLINSLWSYHLAVLSLLGFILLMTLTYKRMQNVYDKIEGLFFSNLNDKEEVEVRESGMHLVPWDAHITSFIINADFTGIGKTLMELRLREDLGVNLAMIRRGPFTIHVPDRLEKIYPGDVLYVIGTDEQVEAFKKYLELNSRAIINYNSADLEVSLQQIEITEGSEFEGKSIKDSAIRERTKGLIVGIERRGERLLNPESAVVLEAFDVLWVVGNTRRIKLLQKKGAVS